MFQRKKKNGMMIVCNSFLVCNQLLHLKNIDSIGIQHFTLHSLSVRQTRLFCSKTTSVSQRAKTRKVMFCSCLMFITRREGGFAHHNHLGTQVNRDFVISNVAGQHSRRRKRKSLWGLKVPIKFFTLEFENYHLH